MAKKRTCCIGWMKDLQRMKARVLNMAPAVGPEETGRLLDVVSDMHSARVRAIRDVIQLKKIRQNNERRDHYDRNHALPT